MIDTARSCLHSASCVIRIDNPLWGHNKRPHLGKTADIPRIVQAISLAHTFPMLTYLIVDMQTVPTRHSESAFTLIELMIVIAIISILIAIALPSYQNYTRRAHFTELVQAAAPLKLAVEQCYQMYDTLNECHSGSGGIEKTTPFPANSLVHTAEVEKKGVIHLIPKARYGILASSDYQLIPEATQHGLIWHAEGGAIKQGLVHGRSP